jgi:hypothetical protein
VGAPICHYAVPVPSRWVYVDKQTFAWRGIRRLLLSQRNRIPAKFLPMTQWIIPPPDGTVVSSTNETSSSDD